MFNHIKILFVLICFSFVFFVPPSVFANNKYGVHILETTELEKASTLVNSSGGDWGYITIVLRDDDFDKSKWQSFFDDCRRKHIVPIVRIATHMQEKGSWAKPDENDLDKWVIFLADLNWPVKDQLVIVFNEPNHAKEWGGSINPEEYGKMLGIMIDKFGSADPNFVVMNAGFDQAADNSAGTMDESLFLPKMFSNTDLVNKLEAWSSHSYPNHGFIGTPEDTGKGSIVGYKWELEFLKSVGLGKNLNVYITETGWPHKQGLTDNSFFYDQEQVADFFAKAFDIWEKDDQVLAVTPFVLNYNAEPFDHFSWLDKDGNEYKQAGTVLSAVKICGEPEQLKNYELTGFDLPELLPTDYEFKTTVGVKNNGQWIMGERDDFSLLIEASKSSLFINSGKISKNNLLEPGSAGQIDLNINTGTMSGEHKININGKQHSIVVFKPWSLNNPKVSFWKQLWINFSLRVSDFWKSLD